MGSKISYKGNEIISLNEIENNIVENSVMETLKDLRVGYDGTVYDTAGNSVRGQAGKLDNKINNILIYSNMIGDAIDTGATYTSSRETIVTVFNSNTDTYTINTRLTNSGTEYSAVGFNVTPRFRLTGKIILSQDFSEDYTIIATYAEDGTLLQIKKPSQLVNRTYTPSAGDYWFRVVFKKLPFTVQIAQSNELPIIEIPWLSVPTGRSIIRVGQDKDYRKLSDGVKAAVSKGDTDVIIDAGTYDILSELSIEELHTKGIRIGNNVRLYGNGTVIINCLYDGDDVLINREFSVFMAMPSNYELHNITINSKNTRYCVHDECDGIGSYVHKYIDCNMTNDNSGNLNFPSPQCIGGGLGEYATIIVEGGYYNSVPLYKNGTELREDPITYHNPSTGSDFLNTVVIRNVYCEHGTCYVSVLGDSSKLSLFSINGCSMTAPPYINGINNPALTHNFKIISWGNEIRDSSKVKP